MHEDTERFGQGGRAFAAKECFIAEVAAEHGILPFDPIELINGVVYEGGMRRRFALDDLQRMVEAGILSEDERARHAACVNRLIRLFVLGLGERAVVGVRNTVRLEATEGPQPDLTIALPRADFYASGHPTPEDILLLVEVSDSSLPYDLTTKVPLYARHGVHELWLVDLSAETVEVYRRPARGLLGRPAVAARRHGRARGARRLLAGARRDPRLSSPGAPAP